MERKHCYCIWQIAILSLGTIFMAAGVFMYINWIDIFTRLRGKEMALSPTSPSYSGWKVSPLPLYLDVYLFNWTNPEDFRAGSTIKPHFQELGPYRFREIPDKVDIEWHNQNHSVSFRKKAIFYFDARGSNGTLQDLVTTVNTVAHGAALHAKNGNAFERGMVNRALDIYGEKITTTKTADEWIFKGYTHPFVTLGNFLSKFSSKIEVPFSRIGWMFSRNDSSQYDGHFNIYTGTNDIYKMGQIHAWNGMEHNGRFPGECGRVKGSMGEFFPPNLSTNDSISIYLHNLCRSIPLDYAETVEIHSVKAYKFSGGERSVDNGTRFPEAKCFCVNNKCEASGVINISPCKYNSSVYMSYPHFYKADRSFLEAIDGLEPIRDKHEFFMTLEPNSGIPMDVGGGFQANYLLESINGFPLYQGIKRTFIPIMWAEERVRVTEEIAKDIALVPFIILLGQIVTSVLLASGVIFICWYPTKSITRLFKDPKSKTSFLQPLNVNKTITITPQSKAKARNAFIEGSIVPLLDYKDGSFILTNSTGSEDMIGNTFRKTFPDVINR